MSLHPTLEDIFHEPTLARELTPESAFTLLTKVTSILPILVSRASVSSNHRTQEDPRAQERWPQLFGQHVLFLTNQSLV
jgi:hypothetical protein